MKSTPLKTTQTLALLMPMLAMVSFLIF